MFRDYPKSDNMFCVRTTSFFGWLIRRARLILWIFELTGCLYENMLYQYVKSVCIVASTPCWQWRQYNHDENIAQNPNELKNRFTERRRHQHHNNTDIHIYRVLDSNVHSDNAHAKIILLGHSSRELFRVASLVSHNLVHCEMCLTPILISNIHLWTAQTLDYSEDRCRWLVAVISCTSSSLRFACYP